MFNDIPDSIQGLKDYQRHIDLERKRIVTLLKRFDKEEEEVQRRLYEKEKT